MEGDKAKKISLELEYMLKHPSLGTGRFTAPDGAKQKQRLLADLTEILNSLPNGVTKAPEKWYKDWRNDTKSKAAALKREMNETGGGPLRAKQLTPLEEKLLSFLGPSCVHGHAEVADPMVSVTTATVQQVIPLDYDTVMIPLDMPGPSSAAQALPPSNPDIDSPVFIPLVNSPLASPTPSVSEDSASPWPQTHTIRPVSRSSTERPKRRRQTDSSMSDVEDTEGGKIITFMERQVALHERHLDIQERQLEMQDRQLDKQQAASQLQERYCVSAEMLSSALCSAMKMAEKHFKKTD